APSVTVQDEDDLAETVLYVWVDNLTKTTGSSLYFDVYSVFPTDLVMWTASTKGSRLHRGVVDNNCITEQTRLTTLSNASGQNVFTRTVYMEAVNVITGTVTLQAMPVLNTNALSGSDSVKMTGYIFDVDMNTDNFDGTMITSLPTMPARIEREEIYEDHEYGLGIVMLADEPLTPEVEQYYYPMVIEVTSSMAILSPKITFDHVESTKSGGIQIYQLVNGNYQLLQSETEYTLEQLGFTNTLNIATIYVLPTRKHQVVSEWFNPFLNNTKPDSEITVTFSFNNITLEENIHYIISSQASFWNNYLHNPSIRSAFAATGVYGSDADTPTAHATPTSLDLPQFSLQLINNSSNLMEMGFDEETAELFGANNQNGLNVCVYYDHITGNAILAFQGSDPLALAKPIFASSGLFTQDQMNTWSSSKILRKLSGSSKINEALQKLNDGLIYGSSTPDWVCNVAQSKGYATPQYDTAMYIGQRLPKNFVNVNSAISINKITGWTITGHSLGGGLASAAASVCGNLEGPQSIGNRAETFNAAGLHSNTVSVFLNNTSYRASGTSPSIIAYRTESDELTELQEYAPVSACNALGTPYCLEDFVDDGNTNAISEVWPGHEMKSVIQGLLVDIMVHPSGNLIIDSNDGVCVNGTWQWTVSGTILVGTTPYAY
ncbi:MAG: hypothetical protein LBE13_05410, partial [Bacteroidales bacterium]|nr:hypothetical protein [Bacteroidales bacterium]